MHEYETIITDLPKLNSWDGQERRKGPPAEPVFAPLLIEAEWILTDDVRGEICEGWLRASGHANDRRR